MLTKEESDGSKLRVLVESLGLKPAKPKTAYACFCIERLTPIHTEIWEWTTLNYPSGLPSTWFNHAVTRRLSSEWKALSREQKQAYKPASECAKADPHTAGQGRIKRPKPEKRQRVWQHSREAGVGGEGARARLEVNIKQPRAIKVTKIFKPRVIETASARTTAPPGGKWNARAKKWERAV